MTVAQRVREIIAEDTGTSIDEITLDTLVDDYVVSLDEIEVMMQIEQEYGMRFTEKSIRHLTIRQLINCVENKLNLTMS